MRAAALIVCSVTIAFCVVGGAPANTTAPPDFAAAIAGLPQFLPQFARTPSR